MFFLKYRALLCILLSLIVFQLGLLLIKGGQGIYKYFLMKELDLLGRYSLALMLILLKMQAAARLALGSSLPVLPVDKVMIWHCLLPNAAFIC